MHRASGPQTTTPHTAATRGARFGANDAAAMAGFACLLATMLVYSAAAMPFQRFSALPDIVSSLMYALRTGAVAGSVAAVLVMLGQGRLLRLLPVRALCTGAFVTGNALFCAMALGCLGSGLAVNMVAGICIGVGCVGQALAWGRILARYNLRVATGMVAASAVAAALLGWAQLRAPEGVAVALFMAATLATAILAGRLNRTCVDDQADGARPVGKPEATRGSTWTRVRAFLDIALIPAVGLALFAMLMAVRGELFFDNYSKRH